MTGRSEFAAPVAGGTLAGWHVGQGPPVLLLHGGPGVRHDYMDVLADELQSGYRVASFQQRGLAPSTLDGPFTIPQAVSDVISVLDALEWSRALLVGHSWGGHLALRVVAQHAERLLGMLAIDPLGIVGDGGRAVFGAELRARTPKAQRERLDELEKQEKAAELSPEEKDEFQAIIWPAYFADPDNVMGRPPTLFCEEAFGGLVAEVEEGTEEVAAELARGEVPYGVLAGAGSPFPWGQAARPTVELSPSAFLKVVPNAGHFVWYEAPGSVRAALDQLSRMCRAEPDAPAAMGVSDGTEREAVGISLRPVQDPDLDQLFVFERDPAAVAMAAFTRADPSDRQAFDAHYRRVRADPDNMLYAIEQDGVLVGQVASFFVEGSREICYWIDPARWGQGLASAALEAFLDVERTRPLFARVAEHNTASRKVLTRTGFVEIGRETAYAAGVGREIVERVFRRER